MKTPLPPWKLNQELLTIRQSLLDRIGERYKLAYALRYSRGRGGHIQYEYGPPGNRRNGHSDPTHDVAIDKDGMAADIIQAAEDIQHAVKCLDRADEILSRYTEKGHRVKHEAGEVKPDTSQEEVESAAKRYMRKQTRGHRPVNP